MVMSGQRGFFDLDARYAALSAVGDPLEKLQALVDFEIFRPEIDAALKRSDGSKGGRPPMDAVLMFKVLILQTLYGLSDAQAEFQILDRRTFGRFLGLDDGDSAPDETTIWRYREALVRGGAIDALFARFDAHLKSLGYLAMGGQIMDASIIAAPRQRMTDEERAIVKGGGIPAAWAAKPARLAQKDRDARWTLKRGRRKKGPDGKLLMEIATPIFGYKSHIGIDQRHGFIRIWSVSDAARYDGRELSELLDASNTGSAVWADTAYRSQKNERKIARSGRVSKIHFRRAPGKPLPPQRQRANAARSKVRSAVEHVFATQKHRMGLFVRSIGIDRAKARIGLANLVFNFKRYAFWDAKPAVT
jgi:transposase, IS5 family